MGIFIDIGIILFIALCTFIGYKRGLIKLAIRVFALLLALILTMILYKPIAGVIMQKSQIDENISNIIYSKIQDTDLEHLTDEQKRENKLLFLSENYVGKALDEKIDDITKYVADNLAISIVEMITFIVLLTVLRIAMMVLYLLSDFIGSIPLIKQFNEAGGTCVGLIEGIVIVYIVFAIMFILNPFVADGNIEKGINSSVLGRTVYENNIIVNTIAK